MFANKEYIYEVYKEKSFTKAAKNLYISQPSLSLTIKKVESRIGAQIFDRNSAPIQLTDCGKEYISCVEKIMDIENGFATFLSDLNNLKTGTLAIGASNFFASYIMPPIITRFKTKYPFVDIKLVETDTTHLERQLFTGALDLIIDNYAFDDTIYKRHFFCQEQMLLAIPESTFDFEMIHQYCLTWDDIIAGKHLNDKTPAFPLELLKDAPFIMLRPGNDTRVRMDKILAEHNIKPDIVLELDQLATAYHIACHGMGITLTSDTLVGEMPRDKRIVYCKIESVHAKRENFFYYKQNRYITRSMQEFLNIL